MVANTTSLWRISVLFPMMLWVWFAFSVGCNTPGHRGSFWSLWRSQEFWTDIFRNSQQWGFKTYMQVSISCFILPALFHTQIASAVGQDWLNDQFNNMNATTNNVYVARDWLMQMGEGALRNGMTIQYCMSECRHILQSLEIPAVTQTRASDDYQPNDYLQWRIGMSSMLAWAVGLAPFKDTFWTTSQQPNNYYKGLLTFPDPNFLPCFTPVIVSDFLSSRLRAIPSHACGHCHAQHWSRRPRWQDQLHRYGPTHEVSSSNVFVVTVGVIMLILLLTDAVVVMGESWNPLGRLLLSMRRSFR